MRSIGYVIVSLHGPYSHASLSWLMIQVGITYLRFCGHFPEYSSQTMTSFPDYGLKAQGLDRPGVYVGYRSIFRPDAGIYVIFSYVHVCYFHALRMTSSADRSFSSLSAAYRYFGISTVALTSLRHVVQSRLRPDHITNS